jgi:hypothetical protein
MWFYPESVTRDANSDITTVMFVANRIDNSAPNPLWLKKPAIRVSRGPIGRR